MRRRRGMALAVTIGVVSLIAILAVATLSLAGRLMQTSALAASDARLDAGVELGLAAAMDDWRVRALGSLAVGATTSFGAEAGGLSISVTVSVTRVAPEIFWVTAEASGAGGASRRETLVLRAPAPDIAALSQADSANVATVGFVIIDSLAVNADMSLPAGSTLTPTNGVVYIDGDATLVGGTAKGVLIVNGRLTVTGALLYEGMIIARGGISAVVSGVTINGVIRAAGEPRLSGTIGGTHSVALAQDVLRQALTPRPVAGRRWAELP